MSESVRYQHLLQGVLRRWARSTQSEAFVLRGGVLTQRYVTAERRPTRDLDFLGLFPRDLTDTQDRLEEIVSVIEPDGITLHLDTLVGEVIWQETDFSGLRYRLDAEAFGATSVLQLDVGFGDPVVPPAVWIDYPFLIGPPARVLAASPELLVAWKLDGLFDHGAKRWQAKDLYDLHLLTTHCHLDPATLTEGIRVAFAAHGNSLGDLLTVLYDPAWWQSAPSRAKWEKFRKAALCDVPADLPGLAAKVAAKLRPALEPLLAVPRGH
jgi:Nucleotidyl transferase AbiEii toxin, Type IV TA system